MFLLFRFICGVGASSPMAIGGGTIADLYEPSERRKAIALFGLGPHLGPVRNRFFAELWINPLTFDRSLALWLAGSSPNILDGAGHSG